MAKSTKAALLIPVVHAATGLSRCFHVGKIYADPLIDSIPNGGYQIEEASCMSACQATLECRMWVWKEQGDPFRAIMPKGCWLLNSDALMQDVNASETSGRVVSGPKDCGKVQEVSAVSAPNASNASAPVAGAEPNKPAVAVPPAVPAAPEVPVTSAEPDKPAVAVLPAVPAAPEVPVAPEAPAATAAPKISTPAVSDADEGDSIKTNFTGIQGEKSTKSSETSVSGRLHWWSVMLAVLGGLSVLVVLGFILLGGSPKAPKKRKTRAAKLRKGSDEDLVESGQVPRREATPLLQPNVSAPEPLPRPRPAAPVETVGGTVKQMPLVQQAAPVAPMAAPVATYQQLQYMQPLQPAVFTLGQQPAMPARQPVYRAA